MIPSDLAYDALERISYASGLHKQKILRECEGIQPYLLAAYNPYKRYHLIKVKANGPLGTKEFNSDTWMILESLAKRIITGQEAIMIVEDHLAKMTAKSRIMFLNILNKDFRIGMRAKTINKVFPKLIPVHDVMLAKLFMPSRVSYPCFSSPKIDGVRAIYKYGQFYSRGGHKYVGLEHLQEQLKDVTTPLDGELDIPGKSFQVASGEIRSDRQTPDAAFHLLDLPEVKSPFTVRLTEMSDLAAGPWTQNVMAVGHFTMQNLDEVNEFYDSMRRLGYEGAVVKPGDYKYVGTRSFNWMKMKDVLEYDTEVLDVYEGRGKYRGQLGGVNVMFRGQPNDVGGGFSDKERVDFWNEPSLIIGRVIEIHYMEVTDDGNMRHSRKYRIKHHTEVS